MEKNRNNNFYNNIKSAHLILFPAIFLLLFFAFSHYAEAATLHINCGGGFCPIPYDTTVPDTDHPWNRYITAEPIVYKITNGPQNAYILWSSWITTDTTGPHSTGETNCFYGAINQINSNGESPILSGGILTDLNGGWQKKVRFTKELPVIPTGQSSVCDISPQSDLGEADTYFSVEPYVSVLFGAKVDNGAPAGEIDLTNAAAHFSYGNIKNQGSFTAWHQRNVSTPSTYSLLQNCWLASFPAPPSSFPYPGYMPSGYENTAIVGITNAFGRRIDTVENSLGDFSCSATNSPSLSNNYINQESDAFIAHYRNTRIVVNSNTPDNQPLGGTYTITPNNSGTLKTAPWPTTATNVYYNSMTANQTYTLTYIPSNNESVSITVQNCVGGYPTENCDPSQTVNGSSASSGMNYGGKIIFTINTITTPTLYVILSADPSLGIAPLNGVDLTADVSGTATGDIRYRFDCTNDGTYERDFTTTSDPYTAVDLCGYSSAGTYTAKVRVDRQGLFAEATTTINVTVPSGIPALDVTPTILDFYAAEGGANPSAKPVTIKNYGSSDTSLSWIAAKDIDIPWLWLSAPTSGTLSGGNSTQLNVNVIITGLVDSGQEIDYTSTITINATSGGNSTQGSPKVVNVNLHLGPRPIGLAHIELSCTNNCVFNGIPGGASPSPQILTVRNTGSGPLAWDASDNAFWLMLTPVQDYTNAGAESSVLVSVDTTNLPAGVYSAKIKVEGNADNSPQYQDVILSIGALLRAVIECNDLASTPPNPDSDCIIKQGESIEFLNNSTP